MSSIIHLPGMRYIRDGQIESIDDQAEKTVASHFCWKQHEEQPKIASGFYQPADYAQSTQVYESLLRNRSYLDANTAGMVHTPSATSNQQNNHYGFSPQQMYSSPSYFPSHQAPPEPPQPQPQQLDLQKRPIRKRRRPPHSYASLIAQAILTSRDQRLTLREIYEWVQTRYPHLYEANETGWQNTIRHNLSLNRCFRKLPRLAQDNSGKGKGSKGGYWTVDLEQLNNTNFGRQILDSGFLGNIEYWHQQQQEHQQQEQQISQQRHMSHGSVDMVVGQIDFSELVEPFFGTNVQQQASVDHRYTTETDENARMASFLARFSKRPMSSLGSMSSSKTSSVRGSTSPRSPATDMSTPDLSSAQLQQQYHHQKVELDPLLNPSLMRVNNILN